METNVEDTIVSILRRAIDLRDVGLVVTILNYKPTEYCEIASNNGITHYAYSNGGIEMVLRLLEAGVSLNGHDLCVILTLSDFENNKMGTRSNFENTKPLLQYCKPTMKYAKRMVAPLYDNSIEALEWLSHSGFENLFVNAYRLFSSIIENPDVKKVAIFFSSPTGSRWWSNIYFDFPLDGLLTRMDYGRPLPPPSDLVEWKANVDGIVDLFLKNVQTPEENAVMSNFVESHPEYELLERSFIP